VITPDDHDALDAYLADRLAQHERDALERRLKATPDLADELLRLAREETIIRDWAEAETRVEAERLGMARADGDDTSTVEAKQARRSLRNRRVANRPERWPLPVISALAAALLLLVGLFVAFINNRPALHVADSEPDANSGSLTEYEKRRHQAIVKQLRDLNLEREAVETARKRRLPGPKPAPHTAEKASGQIAELDARKAEEAEEAASFIEARRCFVMRQLRVFNGRAPLPDDLDAEELEPRGPVTPKAPVVAETGPVEVGRVSAAKDGKAGVLIRETPEGTQRLELAKDLALLSGDRIETARGDGVPCTSIHLDGGNTIDMDRATSVEVRGRDNVRFHTGRIYAHITVSFPEDAYPEEEPPFSLETEAGRFLAHDLQVELQVTTNELLTKDLTARVDGGKVHLVNRKGCVMGRKGQELRVQKGVQPTRRNFFTKPIWRGRNRTNPGLPIGKGNPVLLSHGFGQSGFNTEYALALAHTGEIDLRGVLIVRNAPGDCTPTLANAWLAARTRIASLRKGGLRFTPDPVMGAPRALQPPASGRYQDVVPNRSPAASRLLVEARRASPDHPLVVVTSGSLTDLASAWLLDQRIAGRVVVVTDAKPRMRDNDPWAFRIVLEEYRCVSVHADVPADMFPTAGLAEKRWAFISARGKGLNFDFCRFACVTVAGFVSEVERARFITDPRRDADPFRFQPDPDGRTWVVKRVDTKCLIQEFESTFVTGPAAK